jgi:hypothetical protein
MAVERIYIVVTLGRLTVLLHGTRLRITFIDIETTISWGEEWRGRSSGDHVPIVVRVSSVAGATIDHRVS